MQKRFVPLLVLAMAALLLGLWAGLARMGIEVPSPSKLSLAHGPLMVSGFLGVLIPLERAAALRRRWMFLVPLVVGAGWVVLLMDAAVGAALMTLGSIGMGAILVSMIRQERGLHTAIMAAGGLAWMLGNLLWLLGFAVFQFVWLWVAFLVLTIVGERVELSRIRRVHPLQERLLAGYALLLLAGSAIAPWKLGVGVRVSGVAIFLIAIWLLRNDIALVNLKHRLPLTRFIAWSLFGGMLWLAVGGALAGIYGRLAPGLHYDATLHAIMVGFVFGMIFAHGPIIFPALLGRAVRYTRAFYVPLLLLHVSLVARLFGDWVPIEILRRWGGLGNAVAILLYLIVVVLSFRSASTD